MRIIFKIIQADLFHRGINTDDPIVPLNVNPETLSPDESDLLFRHLLDSDRGGCDVVHNRERALAGENEVVPIGGEPGATTVVAKDKTFESLLDALRKIEILEMPTHPIDEIAFK